MYVKIKGVSASIYRSFLKRFLIVSLAIIVSFTTVCKPKDTDAGILLTTSIVAGIIAAATGTVWTTTQIIDWFNDKKGMSEDEMEDYFSAEISVDGDGNYVFSDDAKLIINEMLADYDESVTMTYRYPANPDFVDASCFSSKAVYEEFVRVLNDNPDKFFYYNGSTENGYYLWFYVFEGLESAVYAQPDLPVANCSLYDANWVNSFNAYEVCLINGGSREDGYWQYRPNGYSISSVYQFENIPFSDITFKRTVSQGSLFSAPNLAFDFNYHFVISAYSGAFNCYKSVDDMKKDLASQFIGRYTDTYTGTPNYNITTSEVNNVVNNYYPSEPGDNPGGGSGSDDDGGGSSGGVFDDIISGIASGVGSIIKGIFSIVKDLVEAIADATGSIISSITDLLSLLNTDFTDFLSAVFPFLPQEFITILIAGLTLSLLGVIIKIFRG